MLDKPLVSGTRYRFHKHLIDYILATTEDGKWYLINLQTGLFYETTPANEISMKSELALYFTKL
jgi:hypothetical protein